MYVLIRTSNNDIFSHERLVMAFESKDEATNELYRQYGAFAKSPSAKSEECSARFDAEMPSAYVIMKEGDVIEWHIARAVLPCERREITKREIEQGLLTGAITLFDNPNRGVSCRIGNEWFYFGDDDAEELSLAEYTKVHTHDEIVDLIHQTLAWLSDDVFNEDEWWRYRHFLDDRL